MLTLQPEHIKTGKTVKDFKNIEEGNYCQLINGEIIMAPSPSTKHQEILFFISNEIANFLKKQNKGKLFVAPLDVYFNNENAYQPDILFISNEQIHIIKDDGIYGAPDLIIEILSLHNSYHDQKTKKKVYEKHGVKEYWLIDPYDGEATGYKNFNGSFKEFFHGNNEFTIKMLNLKIQF